MQQYEESAWAADFDHEHEGLLREIAFVVPFDASLGGQQKDAGSTPDRSGDSAAAESADGDEDDPAPVVRVREQQRLIHVTSARRAARASHRTSTVERERARRARARARGTRDLFIQFSERVRARARGTHTAQHA